MRSTTIIGAALVAMALTLTGCSTTAPDGDTGTSGNGATQQAPQPSAAVASGTFTGLNGKTVAGAVTIEGSTVTLSGFSSDEGPDLHLYLTNGTDEAAVAAGTEIGTVAYDQKSQTFTLDNVDVAKFSTLVVHCDKAKAVFGAADLVG